MKSSLPLFHWLNQRTSGTLLHISSLPSDTGIGNMGSAAYRFIDFLADSGMRIWQICPLGPTGYGDSPYQCFSAFAGNPYFIDLMPLVESGLLAEDAISALKLLPSDRVDYGALYEAFWPVLRSAFESFKTSGFDELLDYGSFEKFRSDQRGWLDDYSLFLALKSKFGGKCWLEWPAPYRDYARDRKLNKTALPLAEAEAHAFYQYVFYAQLAKLRAYASSKEIEIMGDVPIFVALDSADVWANRSLFQLNKNGSPKAVAGVPPDYFSDDGQLWGNPLYDWKVHEETDFAWWIERVKSNLDFYDIVRLDHFRGFESYWSVPAKDKNARNGKWVQCPGIELFTAIQQVLPHAKFVAEDLGLITEEVLALRASTGLPGMAVLQFAFGGGADNAYLPHNYERNSIVYSGTHDNNTTLGWYRTLAPETQDHVRRYLNVSGDEVAWDFIRTGIKSSAYIAIFPLQDLMSLGSEARMNTPGVAAGNWQWRYLPEKLEQLQQNSSTYLKELLSLSGRI